MNNRKILEAIQGVDTIGTISPNASPPDILGVLMLSVCPDIPWDNVPIIHQVLDKMEIEFDLNSRDVDELLNLSERYPHPETLEERQLRLLDVFAARVEDEELLEEKVLPQDANPAYVRD